MITLNPTAWQARSWQWHLAHAIVDAGVLGDALRLPVDSVATGFPLRVPLPYCARIQPGDPNDPLLRQVLPISAELAVVDGFGVDPLQEVTPEADNNPAAFPHPPKGLLHKYSGRVLMVMTGACGINCRYCFRRHFPYADTQPDSAGTAAIVNYIRADSSIREVILSGGDPLAINDRQLAGLAQSLAQIPHVDTLRIHTRMPVVIPQRVCPALTQWMKTSRLRIVVVIHVNHPQEIDDSVTSAMQDLRATGAHLLNQSVLLRGVNDSADTLDTLSRALFACGVLPYYLHQLDRVAGAAHFEVPPREGLAIAAQLTARLPGYLVPRYVAEIPGETAKVRIV